MTRTEYYSKLYRLLANYGFFKSHYQSAVHVVQDLTVRDLNKMSPKDRDFILAFHKEHIHE